MPIARAASPPNLDQVAATTPRRSTMAATMTRARRVGNVEGRAKSCDDARLARAL